MPQDFVPELIRNPPPPPTYAQASRSAINLEPYKSVVEVDPSTGARNKTRSPPQQTQPNFTFTRGSQSQLPSHLTFLESQVELVTVPGNPLPNNPQDPTNQGDIVQEALDILQKALDKNTIMEGANANIGTQGTLDPRQSNLDNRGNANENGNGGEREQTSNQEQACRLRNH